MREGEILSFSWWSFDGHFYDRRRFFQSSFFHFRRSHFLINQDQLLFSCVLFKDIGDFFALSDFS